MRVELLTVKLGALAPPNETVVAPVKPVPLIVTDAPPAVEIEVGETEVTVGT